MFDRKMKYMFNQYVVAVDKLGNDFDADRMVPYFNKALVKAGFNINTKQFFNRVWAELDHGRWKPSKIKLNKFLNVQPNRVLEKNLTDNIVKANLRESTWSDYRSESWVKKQKAISFLKDHRLHDGKPVTVVKRNGKSFTVAVFLGDLSKQVGITAPKENKAYATAFDVVENEIGKEAALTRLNKMYAYENIEVTNWPDLTDLDNVEYEVVFSPDDDWAESLIYETADEVAATLQKLFV